MDKLKQLEQYTAEAIKQRELKLISTTIEMYNKSIVKAMRANRVSEDRTEKILLDVMTIFSKCEN